MAAAAVPAADTSHLKEKKQRERSLQFLVVLFCIIWSLDAYQLLEIMPGKKITVLWLNLYMASLFCHSHRHPVFLELGIPSLCNSLQEQVSAGVLCSSSIFFC
uniref:Uncharacterized protein n=1 Tax=Oryza glumipatula TaxID=40148 RepID=A0A0E0BMF3_9ORYZ